MRFWNWEWVSAAVNVIQVGVILFDVAAGLSSSLHHHWALGAINFVMAAWLVAMNLWLRAGVRKHTPTREQFMADIAEHEMRITMTLEEVDVANRKARANLLRVAKVTGARIFPYPLPPLGESLFAEIVIGATKFQITSLHIRSHSDLVVMSTCYHHVPNIAPRDEIIAGALLLLKHDPSIFKRWRRQDNFYA